MVTLQATTAYPYANRSLKAGDTFEASEQDAQLLRTVGLAVDPSSNPPKAKRQYRRRDLRAEE